MNTFDLTLDLSKRGLIQTVTIRQGDQNATTIVATITDHGVAASTSGMTARFSMRLPNGTEYYRKAASLSGNTATVTIDEAQAASAVGRTDVAYFQLLQGSTVVASTESFTVVVLPDALADATVPESYDSAIQDAIDALDDAVEQLPSTVEDVLADHPEWTTTVQDGSITEAKLATDLARDRERLLYRLDNLLTAQLPEGETATASDAARTPVAGLALYGRSTQDGTPTPSAPVAIQSVGGQPVDANGWTNGGIDGSTGAVLTNLTRIHTEPIPVGGGRTYVLTWDDVATYGLEVYQYAADGSYVSTSHAWRTSPYLITLAATTAFVRLLAYNKTTTDIAESEGVVFKARMGDRDIPYVESMGLWAQGKNLLPFTAGTSTSNGVTFSVSEDGTITASGTSTGLATLHSTMRGHVLPAGTYTLSGCPSGGSDSTYRIDLYQVGSSVAVAVDYGSGATFTVGEGMNVDYCRIRIPNGANVSGKVFRPMLRLASAGAEFEPYTSTVTPIDLDGHELRSLPDGTRDELTVDSRGHAVLVHRVGSVTLDGSESWSKNGSSGYYVSAGSTVVPDAKNADTRQVPVYMSQYEWSATAAVWASGHAGINVLAVWIGDSTWTSVDALKAHLAASPMTLLYPLATPVTLDLGTIDPVPLVGPDLTAQAVPTAPMQLTYERDLDATLARLESAIANLV